jgi:dTDP-4-amino-4,6-dideoxygalactose transaminase
MSRIHLSSPDVGPLERESLLRAFDEGWIAPVGPDVDGFEADVAALIGWPGAVALSSGTAALHLGLLQCGVGPGDDVFVSTFTFAAPANAVAYCGANPVFVDSDAATWNMSPALLDKALTEARAANRVPKAAVVVDLYGQCADYDELRPLLEEHGVTLIEDAAEALGASYKGQAAGTMGAMGVFSFNGNKIITTSGGGMFVTPDREVADRVRYLATQARQPAVHYEHRDVGYNYRLSNLLAALGRAQLRRLAEMKERRLAISDRYRAEFGDVDRVRFMPIAPWGGWNGWLTCVVFDRAEARDAAQAALEAADIESRPLWKPMHLQPAFAGAAAHVDGTSEELFRRGLCLPSGSVMTLSDVDRVCAALGDVLRSSP